MYQVFSPSLQGVYTEDELKKLIPGINFSLFEGAFKVHQYFRNNEKIEVVKLDNNN